MTDIDPGGFVRVRGAREGGGDRGGTVVATGRPTAIAVDGASVTGPYLAGRLRAREESAAR